MHFGTESVRIGVFKLKRRNADRRVSTRKCSGLICCTLEIKDLLLTAAKSSLESSNKLEGPLQAMPTT